MQAAAFDDVWAHAQNVRMWLATAQQNLGLARRTKSIGLLARFLSRGRFAAANVDEAVDAIGKAKLAFLDLEFAQHRAGMERTQLRTLQLDLVKTLDLGVVRVRLSDEAVDHLRTTVAADLETIDALVAAVETRQRAAR